MVRTRSKLLVALLSLLALKTARAGSPFYASLPPPRVLLIGQGPMGETMAEHWRAVTPVKAARRRSIRPRPAAGRRDVGVGLGHRRTP